MERDVKIAHDLESTPLMISTVGDGVLSLFFFDKNGDRVGELNFFLPDVDDVDPPFYQIGMCADTFNADNVSIDTQKIWTITKPAGPRMTIHCNAEKVADVSLSPTTCTDDESDWTRQVGQIMFDELDSESDFYRPAKSGNVI